MMAGCILSRSCRCCVPVADAAAHSPPASSSSAAASPPSLTPAAMAATTDLVAGATRWRRALDAALRRDYAAPAPRLALLALNPHAGDGGRIGPDEQTWLADVVLRALREGLNVRGPLAADGFFASKGYRSVDGTLALYHDQGLIPFKMLAFHDGVNATAGLDLVRTSPDHGTAWDLAGRGLEVP